jgi:signal transduction histidine kinase
VKRPHTVAPASIDVLIRTVGETERPVAERHGIRFSLRIGDELTAPVDAYYLRQAMENLVRNAREALYDTPNGAVRIELDRENGFARIRVIDNGPGIPADRIGTIFEPFMSTKGSGMGLGLPITREIIERHGGSVDVESREGEGTTFTVRLPLNPPRVNGTAPAVPESAEERIG